MQLTDNSYAIEPQFLPSGHAVKLVFENNAKFGLLFLRNWKWKAGISDFNFHLLHKCFRVACAPFFQQNCRKWRSMIIGNQLWATIFKLALSLTWNTWLCPESEVHDCLWFEFLKLPWSMGFNGCLTIREREWDKKNLINFCIYSTQ